MNEQRAAVHCCPYCGGEDLYPHEASHGAWECRECRRVFAVRMLGLLNPQAGVADVPHREGPS